MLILNLGGPGILHERRAGLSIPSPSIRSPACRRISPAFPVNSALPADPAGGRSQPERFRLHQRLLQARSVPGEFSGKIGRNSYSLNGDYADGDSARSSAGRTVGTASATLGRDLTRHLHVSAAKPHYSRVERDSGAVNMAGKLESETKSAAGRIDYRLGPTVYTSLRYVYLQRAISPRSPTARTRSCSA